MQGGILTNAQVRQSIFLMTHKWWQKTVALLQCARASRIELKKGGQSHKKEDPSIKNARMSVGASTFVFGHLLHMFQDSYALGHALRDWDTQPDGETACGNIRMFQE